MGDEGDKTVNGTSGSTSATSSSSNASVVLVNENRAPPRIVSLLPSITEILASLGVADQIVGITHECDYPSDGQLSNAKIVTTSDINPHTMSQSEIHEAVCGSLKNGHSLYGLNKNVLQSVQADMIFTQQLCDVCAVSYPIVLETCAQIVAGPPAPPSICSSEAEAKNAILECPYEPNSTNNKQYPKVISLEPTNLNDVMTTIQVAGKSLGLEPRALEKINELQTGFDHIREVVVKNKKHRPKVAFMEWHNPIFSGGHWICDMLDIAGAQYDMCESGGRSKPFKDEDFIKLDPDIILVGPCGFDLERTLKDTLEMYKEREWWKDMRAVQSGQLYALDGNSYYARPGPRLLQGCGIMAACIHGDDVADQLGESLAPRDGYRRITLDMYNK